MVVSCDATVGGFGQWLGRSYQIGQIGVRIEAMGLVVERRDGRGDPYGRVDKH